MAKRKNIIDIKSRKGKNPLVVLTASTAPFAKTLDPHTDILLVGDSLGMALYGMDSTLSVTVDMMIAHGRAVVKISSKSLVVVDLPFGSYQGSPEQAFESASRLMAESGCNAVKIEGGETMADTISFLSKRGIPVMAHIGLTPQSVHALGGYKAQGLGNNARQNLINDARAIEEAGAFSVVLEHIEVSLAEEITNMLLIPTIGIGASNACDGQVLVTEDMAGLTAGRIPPFAKKFGAVGKELEESVKKYSEAVKSRSFPAKEHCTNSNEISAKVTRLPTPSSQNS